MRADRLLFCGVAVVGGIAALATLVVAAVFGVAAGDLLWAVAGPVPLYLAGLFAFSRRPDHAAVRCLLSAGSLLTVATLFEYLLRLNVPTGAPALLWGLAAGLIVTEIWASVAGIGFFALFPVGRPERPYERVIVKAALLTTAAVSVLVLTSRPTMPLNPFSFPVVPDIPNLLFVSALAPLGDVMYFVYAWYAFGLLLPFAVVMLVVRYRRAEYEQRRQIRWLVLAASAGLLGSTWWVFGTPWLPEILFFPCWIILVACIVIALLDAGLLDVDRLIRKSLVYGTLWLLIALGYVGAAAALGVAASNQLPVSVAIVLTIVATLVFLPARHWLGRLAERWVFGERVSHYDVVTRFGDALEQAGDLDELLPRLAETVRHGLGLKWARVRLDPIPDRPELRLPLGAAGSGGNPEAVVPLLHDGESVGAIECGPKLEGQLTSADHRLLATLAGQAATLAYNLRLKAEQAEHLAAIRRQTAELTESRARVVQVQNAERRRLQRDLHDGLQQSVAALTLRLGLARNQLRRSDDRTATTLAELQSDLVQLLDELRELAHSVRPAVLSDRGLLEAVEAQASRLPIPVEIDADQALRGARFPDQVEDAAWYGIAEGMTNALKHAEARRIVVGLARHNGHLEVEVCDDGRGFDPDLPAGFGLAALADRMAVLGGRLSVDSGPGRGARLRMTIPLTNLPGK